MEEGDEEGEGRTRYTEGERDEGGVRERDRRVGRGVGARGCASGI